MTSYDVKWSSYSHWQLHMQTVLSWCRVFAFIILQISVSVLNSHANCTQIYVCYYPPPCLTRAHHFLRFCKLVIHSSKCGRNLLVKIFSAKFWSQSEIFGRISHNCILKNTGIRYDNKTQTTTAILNHDLNWSLSIDSLPHTHRLPNHRSFVYPTALLTQTLRP